MPLPPLNDNDIFDLKLRAEQSLMLLGGTHVRVRPEELLYLVEAILDSASNDDLEKANKRIEELEDEVIDLQIEVGDLKEALDAAEAA